MIGATRIVNVDGEILVMVDGVSLNKKVTRATFDAVAGQPTKLYLEFDIQNEMRGQAETIESGLSVQSKAEIAIEMLSYLEPEELERVLCDISGPMAMGVAQAVAELIEARFIGGESNGNTDGTEPGFRDEDFPTLF
jgi:hypothetical protein